ncbi:sensor histidine kinase [Pseudorhodoplanes sinuspersici]|nr:HWE histidine kinase domain-containing protein [Pseudorhodoplanes sinuspersici]
MPRVLLALLILAGVLLSVYIANQEARQYRTVERLRIGEIIDSHFGTVSEHILARSSLAKTVARFFVPPPLSTPRALGAFGDRALGLAPDLTTIGWLPEVVDPPQAAEVLQALRAAGVEQPGFRGPGDKPIDPATLKRPMFPIVDIAPEKNRFVLGVDAGAFPERLQAILQAKRSHDVSRTRPLSLVQSPDERALLLYAPIYDEGGGFLGVMGFGFRIDHFFRNALSAGRVPRGATVSVFTHDMTQPLYRLTAGGVDDTPKTPSALFERKMEFGNSELRFVYSVPRNLSREGFIRGLWMASAGFALTGASALLLGFIWNRANALSEEVASRRSAEDRLKVLIHELNHRVRNVMAVAQAVVRLSFTPGLSLAEIQKTAEGRLQALARALSLLTDSDWKSLSLQSLISEEIIPFAGRISMDGPDIALRARAAQTFALLFYELATNAAKHGALSVPDGKVDLTWRIDNLGGDPIFHLHWKESGGPRVDAPSRRGFGELLVRRIAPRDVAGKSQVRYDADGFEYELEAPLQELIGPQKDEDAPQARA